MSATHATPEDRAKLIKLLGLLGSDHAGERDAAGLAAVRHLKSRGLTWADVIQSAPDPFGRHGQTDHAFAGKPPPSTHELIQWCIARGGFLTKWERDFLHGLVQWGWCERLTRKQQSVVDDIVMKIRVGLRDGVAA